MAVVGVRPLRRWFLPQVPDLLGLLAKQGETTIAGMEAFSAWAHGAIEKEAAVRMAEHEADKVRRELLTVVRRAFITPIGPEDAFELSERFDAVINGAKNLVREAELLAMAPDSPMAEMIDLVAEGVRDLVQAFRLLADDPDRAVAAADSAVHHQRRIERVYRRAMSDLLAVDQVREVQGRRELYRRCARLGDAVEHVAHRVWYTVVKKG